MAVDLSVTFTGLRFENPFLLSSAPPTESDSNIMRAFDAGWAGVVTKTIGLHPVTNVKGPKTKFIRADPDSYRLSMQKRPGTALHSSWNWELISDKTIDWWLPRLVKIKQAFPDRILIASIMAGSGNDKELRAWQTLATSCQDAGVDAFELNLSCPHMDRQDMGSNIGKDQGQISIVTKIVKEVAKVPVWCKLTPSTTDIVGEARASFLGGADAIVSSNTFPSLPLIDPATLDFEVNVEGLVSSGGLGGPAILPQSLAKISQMTQAFPDRAFSGIGGIGEFAHALSYFLLGCGTVQVCTAAMLDHAVGPNIIKALTAGMREFLERNAAKGWTNLEDFRGLRRANVVPHSQIKRPDTKEYFGGHEAPEGYASPETQRVL
jgi:dihydropyrimidine dehydrogenase (NAD+) subunit PreA